MSVYGSGADGDVTLSSNTSLSADKEYNSLTVNNGVTLNTAGYSVKVKTTLTNNGTITDSTTGGSAGTYGAGSSTKGVGGSPGGNGGDGSTAYSGHGGGGG